jgi:hypothetical protein
MKRPHVTWPPRRSPQEAEVLEPDGHRDGHAPRPLSGADEIFVRHPSNPILTAADLPFEANVVFNPGATMLESGETLMLVRVEDRRGLSQLHVGGQRTGSEAGGSRRRRFCHPKRAASRARGASKIHASCTAPSSAGG